MNQKKVNKMIKEYLDKGGKITKLKIGQTSEDENVDMNLIDKNLPTGFESPDVVYKDELKDIL